MCTRINHLCAQDNCMQRYKLQLKRKLKLYKVKCVCRVSGGYIGLTHRIRFMSEYTNYFGCFSFLSRDRNRMKVHNKDNCYFFKELSLYK